MATPVDRPDAADRQFIALHNDRAAAGRRTVAQKPPLRFFSSPYGTSRKAQAALPNLSKTASPAAAETPRMSSAQAQLLLSIFEE